MVCTWGISAFAFLSFCPLLLCIAVRLELHCLENTVWHGESVATHASFPVLRWIAIVFSTANVRLSLGFSKIPVINVRPHVLLEVFIIALNAAKCFVLFFNHILKWSYGPFPYNVVDHLPHAIRESVMELERGGDVSKPWKLQSWDCRVSTPWSTYSRPPTSAVLRIVMEPGTWNPLHVNKASPASQPHQWYATPGIPSTPLRFIQLLFTPNKVHKLFHQTSPESCSFAGRALS